MTHLDISDDLATEIAASRHDILHMWPTNLPRALQAQLDTQFLQTPPTRSSAVYLIAQLTLAIEHGAVIA